MASPPNHPEPLQPAPSSRSCWPTAIRRLGTAREAGEAWLLAHWRLWLCLTISGYLATQFLPALLAAGWPNQFETLNTPATPRGMLDFQMARTSGIATVMMDVWGPLGRQSAWVNLAGDVVLICGYGPLFMAGLIGVARRVSAISHLGGFLGHLFAYVLQSEKAPFPWHPVILRIGFGGRAPVLDTAREDARRARRKTGNEGASPVEPPLPPAAAAEFQQWQQVATRTSARGASAPRDSAPGPGFEELLTPLQTLWQTWEGHGLTEYRKFKMRLEEHRNWRLVEFSFWEYSQPLPLGWLLSQAAREDLQWQVAGFDTSGQPHAAATLAAQIQRAAQEADATLNERHLADILTELQPRQPATP